MSLITSALFSPHSTVLQYNAPSLVWRFKIFYEISAGGPKVQVSGNGQWFFRFWVEFESNFIEVYNVWFINRAFDEGNTGTSTVLPVAAINSSYDLDNDVFVIRVPRYNHLLTEGYNFGLEGDQVWAESLGVTRFTTGMILERGVVSFHRTEYPEAYISRPQWTNWISADDIRKPEHQFVPLVGDILYKFEPPS